MDPVATFHRLWELREPLEDPPGWQWTADKYLVDYVIALEVAMGLRQPEVQRIPVILGEDEAAPDDGRNAAPPKAYQKQRRLTSRLKKRRDK